MSSPRSACSILPVPYDPSLPSPYFPGKHTVSSEELTYHTFIDYPNAPAGGIIVPQKVYRHSQLPLHYPSVQFEEHPGSPGLSLQTILSEGMATTASAAVPFFHQGYRFFIRIEVRTSHLT